MNILSPMRCCGVSASTLPSAKWSYGASSETSVASYAMIASPQNIEKFASITLNWSVGRLAPLVGTLTPGITARLASTTEFEFHQRS